MNAGHTRTELDRYAELINEIRTKLASYMAETSLLEQRVAAFRSSVYGGHDADTLRRICADAPCYAGDEDWRRVLRSTLIDTQLESCGKMLSERRSHARMMEWYIAKHVEYEPAVRLGLMTAAAALSEVAADRRALHQKENEAK